MVRFSLVYTSIREAVLLILAVFVSLCWTLMRIRFQRSKVGELCVGVFLNAFVKVCMLRREA